MGQEDRVTFLSLITQKPRGTHGGFMSKGSTGTSEWVISPLRDLLAIMGE
jgi:hypothetical protein